MTAALTERRGGGAPTMAAARRLAYGSASDLTAVGGGAGSNSGSRHGSTAGAAAAATAAHGALALDQVDCVKPRGNAPAGPQSPQSHCKVLPGSCELLSHGVQVQGATDTEVGLFLRVLGAPWSPELVLHGSLDDERDRGAARQRQDPLAKASESLREGRPVLLSAHVPEHGVVLDVVAHLQVRIGVL